LNPQKARVSNHVGLDLSSGLAEEGHGEIYVPSSRNEGSEGALEPAGLQVSTPA